MHILRGVRERNEPYLPELQWGAGAAAAKEKTVAPFCETRRLTEALQPAVDQRRRDLIR